MADPSRLHLLAFAGLITAALPDTVDLYTGRVSKPDSELRWPYLVLWPSAARRATPDLNGYAGQVSTRTQITGAGTTIDEALAVLDRASEALHGVTPTIVGRDCGWIRVGEDVSGPTVAAPGEKTADGRDIYVGYLFAELTSTPT